MSLFVFIEMYVNSKDVEVTGNLKPCPCLLQQAKQLAELKANLKQKTEEEIQWHESQIKEHQVRKRILCSFDFVIN